MALSQTEQAFLQKLMTLNVMSSQEVIKWYNKSEVAVASAKNRHHRRLTDILAFKPVMARINSVLTTYGFLLKTGYSPWDRASFWGFVNTLEDEATREGKAFSKNEYSMFFEMVDEMVENDGSMHPNRAKEIGNHHTLSTVAANSALLRMAAYRWIKMIPAASYGAEASVVFGPRAILELPRVRNCARIVAGAHMAQNRAGDQADDAQ